MRVVCDNCGAVYKIADSKLSKDVNKATCKRCGHKIVIYRPGFRPPQEVKKAGAPAEPEAEERTVIKSVEGLDKLDQPSGNMPAIGSLTAELRAISLPGVKPVAPAAPAALRPPGAIQMPPPKLGMPPKSPPSIGMPPKSPPIGIPPKDSPPTAHYGGPRPSLPQVPGVPVAPPPSTPSEGDKTRPMTQPPAPSNGGAPAVRPVVGRAAPTPSLKTPSVARPPSVKTPVVTPPPQAPKAPPQAPKAVTSAPRPPSTGDGSAELGVVAGLGAVGLLGAAVAALLPPPLFSAGIGLAGFAAATCLFLSILSQRGRKKGQAFAAVFIGLLIGGAIGFLAHTRAAENASTGPNITSELPDPIPPVVEPTPAPEPEPTGTVEEGAEDGLSEEERAEARKFSGEEIAGLGGNPEPTPAPKPVAEPTPAPRRDPTPAPKVQPKEEPTPKAESGGRRPVGPGAPPEEKTPKPKSSTAAGPSPFVVDTIIRNNANIQRCFSLEKTRGTDISGKIYLKFSISPDGGVSRARITTSRFAGTALDQCVSKEVNQLKFPEFDGESQNVRYPFNVL